MAAQNGAQPLALKSDAEVDEILAKNSTFLTVASFIAPWSEHCTATKELTRELMSDPDNKQVLFIELSAEDFPKTCSKYEVKSVPTILLFRDQKVIDRLTGQDARHYAARVAHHVSAGPSVSGEPVRTIERAGNDTAAEKPKPVPLEDRLRALINRANVMVFMKGNPTNPRCGFSRQIIEILRETGVPFETFDILEDEEVRQGLKDFSKWQTYPQVYVKGDLAGGLDVIRDLKEMGNLVAVLNGTEQL